MAVRIRLTRVGATKRPAYRVIAIDQRRSRDGRALEILGVSDPLTEPATVQLQSERISAWIGKGAQPSDTVVRLMRQAERAAASPTPPEKPKRPARPASKPKAAKAKAGGKAGEATAAAEEPVAEEPAATAGDDAQPETAAATEAATEADAAPTADDAGADDGAATGETDTERDA